MIQTRIRIYSSTSPLLNPLSLSLSLIKTQFQVPTLSLSLSLSLSIVAVVDMELFLELLFTLAFSLLLSFLLAKLLSMASSDDVAEEKSVSVTEVVKKPVLIETEKYRGFDSEKRERFVEEVINCDEIEEKGFFIRVETIRSSVLYNDTEIHDNGEVSSGVVGVEERVCKEEEIEKEENLLDESSERVKFCETDIELENIDEESPEKVEFGEIEVESENPVDGSSDNLKFCKIGIESESLVEEIPEMAKFHGIDEVGVAKCEEIGVFESNKGNESDEVHRLNIELIESGVLERVKFCETDTESENNVVESPEKVMFREIERESDKLVEEIPENVKFQGIDEVCAAKCEEIGVFESNKGSESDEVHKLKTELIETEVLESKDNKGSESGEVHRMKVELIETEVLESKDNKGNDSDEVHRIKIELIETEVLESKDNKGSESDGVNYNAGGDEGEGLFDDWEGIERTDLEKQFGAAMVFVGSKSNADRISSLQSDVKMQLYGLHKVAIEGPCCKPQPMALKVSARAHWNAWRQLGNMSREVAMEEYITLLSRSIPGWKGDDTTEDEKYFSNAGAESVLPSKLHNQPGAENEMANNDMNFYAGCFPQQYSFFTSLND